MRSGVLATILLLATTHLSAQTTEPSGDPQSVDAREAITRHDAVLAETQNNCIQGLIDADRREILDLELAEHNAMQKFDLDEANRIKAAQDRARQTLGEHEAWLASGLPLAPLTPAPAAPVPATQPAPPPAAAPVVIDSDTIKDIQAKLAALDSNRSIQIGSPENLLNPLNGKRVVLNLIVQEVRTGGTDQRGGVCVIGQELWVGRIPFWFWAYFHNDNAEGATRLEVGQHVSVVGTVSPASFQMHGNKTAIEVDLGDSEIVENPHESQ